MSVASTITCVDVCHVDDLTPERGVAALVADEQVALFRLFGGEVLAVQQEDPYSGSHVMSRGLVGTRGQVPTVASPMFKQVFDLRTGECLEPMGKEPQHLSVWGVHVDGNGRVLVEIQPRPRDKSAGPAT
jgi:nitrite reductase (NADH) small subunit